MRTTNSDDVPVAVSIESPYGATSRASVAPGKSYSHAITTRQVSVAAGSVTAEVSATVDGQPVSVSVAAAYGAHACG